MSLTVKITRAEFPEDQEFSISALGVFTNGEGREVTPEQEQAFVDERRISLRDALANDADIEVSGNATAKVPDPEPTEEPTTTETTTNADEGGGS